MKKNFTFVQLFAAPVHLTGVTKLKNEEKMKQLFLTLILMLAVTTIPASAERASITTKGDTTVIVADGDTTVIESRIAGALEKVISGKIMEHLDDTVLDNSGSVTVNLDDDSTVDEDTTWIETNRIWSQRLTDIVAITSVFLVAIVVLVLTFRYLNRRRKYKVIEKAIENNYPLPDGIFGKSTTRVVYTQPTPTMGTPVQGTPVPPPFTQGIKADAQPQQQQAQPQQSQPFSYYADRINWREIQGFNLTAVSLGALLFFLIAGAGPVAALCIIPLFIGASKMFTSYMDQRNAVNAARYYQQPQAPQQQPTAAPTQESAPEQPQEQPTQTPEQPTQL